MQVRDLDWKYTIKDPVEWSGLEDVYIAAYPVEGVRFVVHLCCSGDAWSCLTSAGLTWIIKFDMRSRPDMELSDMAKNIIKHGSRLSNPDHPFVGPLEEFPKP